MSAINIFYLLNLLINYVSYPSAGGRIYYRGGANGDAAVSSWSGVYITIYCKSDLYYNVISRQHFVVHFLQ